MARLYKRHNAHGESAGEVRYAYGDSWVGMALYMDDIKFKTPEEAKKWWDDYLKDHPDYEGEEDVFYGNSTADF